MSTARDYESFNLLSSTTSSTNESYATQSKELNLPMHHNSLGTRNGFIGGLDNSPQYDLDSNARSGEKYREPLGGVDNATFPETHYARWVHSWSWEIGGCLGSLIGFFAMVGLLTAFDGKPQPAWPYGITLNAATSFLATFTKGLMLVSAASCVSQSMWIDYSQKTQRLDTMEVYDAASRGPWGALQLICGQKMRNMACLGALLTLLAIGIDPTVQQSIVVRTHHVESPEKALLPRAQSFTQYDTSIADAGTGDFQPAAALVGLAYSGIFFNSSHPSKGSLDVVPTCPTGNCTFPETQSLAVCSNCSNLTHTVEKKCDTDSRKYGNETFTYTLCTFSLPNGLQVNLTTQVSDKGPPIHSDFEGETIAATALLPLVDATDYGGDSQTTTFTNLSIPYNFTVNADAIGGSFLNITVLNGTASYDQMATHASQCSLYWCVNTYEATVTNGNFVERVISSWRNVSASWEREDSTEYKPMELKAPAISSTHPSSKFVVFFDPHKYLWMWLSGKFTFSDSRALIAKQLGTNLGYYWEPDVTSSFGYEPGRRVRDFVPYLDLRRNIRMLGLTEVSTNLAKAMTTYLRTIDANEQATLPPRQENEYEITGVGPAVGTCYILQVYIEIRWAWIAFLGSVLLLTILFFILTVIQSEKHNVAVWKSSPLALLFHGLEPGENQRNDLHNVDNMQKHAKRMKVRLIQTGSVSRLEEQNLIVS